MIINHDKIKIVHAEILCLSYDRSIQELADFLPS